MSGAEEEPPNPNGGNQPPAGAKLRTNVQGRIQDM